jgi:hypothetical protein
MAQAVSSRHLTADLGKPTYSGGKPVPVSLCLPDPGSNLGLRGEKTATNRLSHDTAQLPVLLHLFIQNTEMYLH